MRMRSSASTMTYEGGRVAEGDLRLVGRVARIGREVLDAQAPADHLERIWLEGSHHDDVTVERREGAGEGEGAPVQALAEIQPGGGFLELHGEHAVQQRD